MDAGDDHTATEFAEGAVADLERWHRVSTVEKAGAVVSHGAVVLTVNGSSASSIVCGGQSLAGMQLRFPCPQVQSE